ncbi:microtubule-associated protein Jupiter isoform X3 [Drosophila gunungcola]|uniref:microtubule-associated protein Jupiter isoform X6 n=1 Tax=Drosophila elegans TaxID=30023 RepID=UPI0007E76CA8|nr:microtubule-associated protein Jupiter isoform X6 [Drosophila elegans]XP_052838001.1 microtubule-associated protein Jupiter isoform X3 [Drosophila gunungcola]
MAAYAAFKHVELYNVGKAKKRVLRPPGGGSSDIFGSEMPQTPRNVKNRMVSNIFAAEKDNGVKNNVRQGAHRFYFIGDAPRRGQKTVDSHSRLFGEPSRPITPGKNHMKSSIPFGGQNSEAAAAQKLLTTNGHYNGKSGSVSSASSSVSSSTENLKMNNGSRSEGNPVTGEGYKAGGNDFHQRQESSNGGTPVINKNRVPPGGYSSGLW